MTTYAFDIDGTLTKAQIKTLANDLYDAGHYILVITGGLAEKMLSEEERKQRILERNKQLKNLGVKYTKLEVCIGETTDHVAEMKAGLCEIYKALLIFEDTPKFVHAIERSSDTVGLLLTDKLGNLI